MYRLLLLIAIFALTYGRFCDKPRPLWQRPKLPPWRRRDPPANPLKEFPEIAQIHIDIETALQNYCTNTKNRVNEIYGTDNYILKYDIPEYKDGKFSVKIINRLIQVNAKKETSGNTEEFRDVRLLPDILNYEKTSWTYESKMLKIFIPYSVTFRRSFVKDCGTLNANVIDVPIQKSSGIILRTIDDESASNEGRDDLKSPVVY